jgi:enamine deaminase RidA (YjgF/YER057c/UK114 family)
MHRPINPEQVPAPLGGYAQALEVRPGLRWLHVSGQIPETTNGIIPEDFERQCNLVWDHIDQCLRSAGMRWQHLVQVRTYLVSREHVIPNSKIRQLRLQGAAPALTVMVAQTLDPRWLLEIEAVAAAPG